MTEPTVAPDAVADLPLLPTLDGWDEMRLVAITPCRSLDDIRTVIVGHSNAAAITRALVVPEHDGLASAGPGIAQSLGIAALRRSALRDPYWRLAFQLARTRDLVISWHGNQHNTGFLLAPDPCLDFLPRGMPDAAIDPDATLISEAAVRQHFKPTIVGLGSTLELAGQAPGCRRFVLGTPPPLHSAEVIAERIRRDPFFLAQAAKLGQDPATLRVTPAAVRRKFWWVLQDMMAEIAARQGAIFLPAPDAAFDDHGCLRPSYSAGDVTHANVGYGVLALRQLAEHLV